MSVPIYTFDVDGVLCERGKNIDSTFQKWFIDWMKDKQVTLITGNTRDKTIEKIGIEIVKHATFSFYCLGNSIWYEDEEVLINQFLLTEEEHTFINNYMNSMPFEHKNGNFMEMRKGSLNVSFPGQNSPEDIRKKFVVYDNRNGERIKFIRAFTNLFPRFEAGIGGDVSVDIFLHGCGKEQILELMFTDRVVFFGDRVEELEIDNFLYRKCRISPYEAYAINNSYFETKQILESL